MLGCFKGGRISEGRLKSFASILLEDSVLRFFFFFFFFLLLSLRVIYDEGFVPAGHEGGKGFRMLNRTSNFDSASGIVRIVKVNSPGRFIFHLVHVRGKYFPE